MKSLMFLFLAIVLLTGCASTEQVQEMINQNHQQKLNPKFAKIDDKLVSFEDQLAEIKTRVINLESLVNSAKADSSQALTGVETLSRALNKSQEKAKSFDDQLESIKNQVEAQQSVVKDTSNQVTEQKKLLIESFRKQLDNVSGVLEQLEGSIGDLEQ
jgi:chromosome segregation ATPase